MVVGGGEGVCLCLGGLVVDGDRRRRATVGGRLLFP